jgi:tetratricopeptide (TPR) repeat protein
MLQSKTKASYLIERLNFLTEDEIKNDILMRRLLNEAKALVKRKDADMNDYIALGELYSLYGEPDEVCRTYDKALRKFGEYPDLLGNYAISLSSLNLLFEAYTNIVKAYQLKVGDKNLLDNMISSCVALGRFREAWNWIKQWNQYFPDELHERAEIIRLCYSVVLQNNISDEAIQQLILMTHSLSHENGLYRYKNQLYLQEDEYSNWINREIVLDLPEDEVFDLGAQLAEKFATEEVDPVASLKFVIRLVPKK